MYPSTYVQYFCSFSFTKSTTEWTSKYVFIGALSIMEVLNKYVWSCTLSDIWHKNVNVYSCYIFFKIALPSSTHHVLSLSYNLLMYPKVNFTLLKWRYTPQPSWGHSMPLNPSVPLLLLLSNLQTFSEACAPGFSSSLVLPQYVHHSLSLALGECLDTGHDRGYTYPHPYTVINTVYIAVLQVHQLASNNDLIPPGVNWRARRSRTYCRNGCVSVQTYTICTFPATTACIALGQL